MNKPVEEKKNGKEALHSRYNPVAEAEKYIASLPLRQGSRFFILIEPGMGYMIPIVEKKFPAAKIIILHVEDENIQTVLENAIPDTEAANIEIIEWRPSLSLYKERYVRLLSETAAFIKRADANKRTTAYFGKKWFWNFFKNLGIINEILAFEKCEGKKAQNNYYPFDVPCVITGAGPSLETAIPIIKRLRETKNVFILASSSSVIPLIHAGLQPGMVIATDGGNWALFHLFSNLPPKTSLAVSTVAALPSQMASFPTLLMSDGSLWQKTALTGLCIPFINMAQRGTVTASALDLAFTLFQGNVFIAGMDLANDDIRSHARPYPLDFYIDGADRLKPSYSEAFSTAFAPTTAVSGSMNIYAEWFKRQLPAYPKRLYTIGNNNSVFSVLPSCEQADWTTGKNSGMCIAGQLKKFQIKKENLAERAEEILINAVHTGKTIREELCALLSSNTEEELIAEIRLILRKIC